MDPADDDGAAGSGDRLRRRARRGGALPAAPSVRGSADTVAAGGRPGGRLTRRRLLGVSAAVVAGVGGAVLVASSGRLRGVGPSSAHPPAVLTFQPSGTIPWNRTTVALYQDVLRAFHDANPGVRVDLAPTPWHGNVQAILGGTGADVISDNYPPSYIAPGGNLLLPVDGYLRRDGLDGSQWPAAQLAAYRAAAPDQRLYMLPGYFCPLVYAVRLSDFDAAGVARPDPAWSHLAFAAAAKAVTRESGGKKRFGAVVDWYSDHIGGASWPFFAFGGGMLDGQGGANLSSAGGVQAGEYLYEELLWPGVATTRDLLGPGFGSTEFVQDRTTMQLSWNGLVLDNAQRFKGFAWDYYPAPTFPRGPTGAAANDFYAIAATTRHPEEAWALLRFLAADASSRGWQRGLMKIGLLQPSLNALWDEWIATMQAAAPPLRYKRLQAFKDMAVSGRAFPQQYYPRLDEQCQNLSVPSLRALWGRSTDVRSAFARIDVLVNALLGRAATVEAAQSRAIAAAAAVTPGAGASYAAPPAAGLGAAATPADQYVLQEAAVGNWTLLGDGTAVGGTSDNTLFACLPVTASEGEWSCRVAAVANISCPSLSPRVQAGLMLRGDLSDDAAMAALHATGAGGIEWRYRSVAAVAPAAVGGFVPASPSGHPASLMSPLDRPAANYLSAPVWLKLRRAGTVWSAFASLDGKTWQQVGRPQTVRAGGVWLGIHCCAHNADWGGSGYVRGVFDHLSFSPAERMQVGDQGVPPVAGPVPADWSTVVPAVSSGSGGVLPTG